MLLYGDVKGRILVKLFTDSEPTLELIVSSRREEIKQLRMNVMELKEKCLEGEVMTYAWLHTREMIADCLTKEMKMPSSIKAVIEGKGLTLKNTI